MIYGLYISATGVLANSYRQDVIANNLANAETVGFKRDLALFREQRTEAASRGVSVNRNSNPMLEELGGGLAVAPNAVDMSQGELEASPNNPLDIAIQGDGFFAVQHGREVMLTRDGRLAINRQGRLALTTTGDEVLDDKRRPIEMTPGLAPMVSKDGTITQGKQQVGRIGLFDVADRGQLQKRGQTLLAYPEVEKRMRPAEGTLQSTFLEHGNVEPSTELTALMDAQRQLEANANMIRYQDQTLARLVNDVGKIG